MADARDFLMMAHFGSDTSARSAKVGSAEDTLTSSTHLEVAYQDNKHKNGGTLSSQHDYTTPDRPELYEQTANTIPLRFGQLRQVEGPSTIPQADKLWTATQRIESHHGHHQPHLRDVRATQLPLNPIREPRLPGPVPRFGFRSSSPLEDAFQDLRLSHSPETPTPAPNYFRPMEKVHRTFPSASSPAWPTSPAPSTPATLTSEQVRNMLNGFSKDYKGKNTVRNMSANIPNSENCSVFIVGLPPNITTNRLLAHVRGVGRVYATVINAPDPAKEHYCSAAKIVFFEKTAASKFHQKCEFQGLCIDGYKARVVWNRVKSAEQGGSKTRSRVLQIVGPAHFVNSASLTTYFHMKLEFQVDEILMIAETSTTNIMEYRFGSYRCQAEAAKMALEREMGDVVKVYFGRDPCDVD